MSETPAETILGLFRGRSDTVAICPEGRWQPFPAPDGIKPEWIERRHLGAAVAMGFYLLTPHNQCHCACLDFDDKPDHPNPEWMAQTEAAYLALNSLGVMPTVEVSQSGRGAHVWIFFRYAIPAWVPRDFLRRVLVKAGLPKETEIFPKQDRLDGPKAMGNLVRYPLWNHSRFVDIEGAEGWDDIDPGKAMAAAMLNRLDDADLRAIAARGGLGDLAEPKAKVESAASGSTRDNLAEDVAKAAATLKLLSGDRADGYDSWLQVGMALHGVDSGSTMLNCWDSWSSRSGKYKPGDCAAKWASFKSGSGVGIGSLIQWAKEDAGAERVKADVYGRPRRDQQNPEAITPEPEPIAPPRHETTLLEILEATIAGDRRSLPLPWPDLIKNAQPFRPGQVAILSGDPGATKSYMSLAWIIDLWRLGIPCAMLMLEEQRHYYLNRVLAMIAGNSNLMSPDWIEAHPGETFRTEAHHRETLTAFEEIIDCAPPSGITYAGIVKWVNKRIDSGKRLLVVDPITLAISTGKPWIEDHRFMMAIKEPIERTGTNILLVTHPRKMSVGVAGGGTDDLAGGAAFGRTAQVVLRLRGGAEETCALERYGGAITGQVNRWIEIRKTRNGIGPGRTIGAWFDGPTYGFEEVGLIQREQQKKKGAKP